MEEMEMEEMEMEEIFYGCLAMKLYKDLGFLRVP